MNLDQRIKTLRSRLSKIDREIISKDIDMEELRVQRNKLAHKYYFLENRLFDLEKVRRKIVENNH